MGEWVGLCKFNSEGKPVKVVGCSCAVIRSWGEETEARQYILDHIKQQSVCSSHPLLIASAHSFCPGTDLFVCCVIVTSSKRLCCVVVCVSCTAAMGGVRCCLRCELSLYRALRPDKEITAFLTFDCLSFCRAFACSADNRSPLNFAAHFELQKETHVILPPIRHAFKIYCNRDMETDMQSIRPRKLFVS